MRLFDIIEIKEGNPQFDVLKRLKIQKIMRLGSFQTKKSNNIQESVTGGVRP